MAIRNNKKLLLVALLGVMGLTACDNDVSSYPKGGDILPPSQGQTVYHNELSDIYESIRDGSLPSDVLDKLLYEYANTIFGRYSPQSPSYSTNESIEKTLKDVVENGDDAAKEEYVKNHKAFWPNATIPETPSDEQIATAVAKLEAIHSSVESRIAEALYNKISGGSYSEHNIFSERKFLASLFFDGKKVADFRDLEHDGKEMYNDLLYPEVEAEDVFDATKNPTGKPILHKEYYYSDEHPYAIEENIESIYRDLLVEQYITDESYTTLGRSYARKVNVLSLTIDTANKNDVPALVDYLVDNIIAAKSGDQRLTVAANDRHGEKAIEELYSTVTKIMNGLPEYFASADSLQYKIVKKLYDDSGKMLFGSPADLVANPETKYLTSTAYGSLMKDYLKIKDKDLVTTDTAIESSFTGGGAYTVETGKGYKEDEIKLKSYTTNGWHLKNGGLSSLPESIRNRLFNLSVASALDSDKLVDRTSNDWNYDTEMTTNKYVAKVNNVYFLKAETVEDKESNRDLYFYDSSSSTYYFVQIIEAVNPAKLSVNGAGRYAELYKDGENNNDILQETIAREVCEQVAKISSYNGLAKDHWLKQMALEYHDTAIYDYFKENYPDLFD